jgi:hypothetical protein
MIENLEFNLVQDAFYLKSFHLIDEKDEFASKLNRYRNLFRDFFGDSSEVSLASTMLYLSNYTPERSDRRLYGIFCNDTLVGQYGLRIFQNQYILLDNAIRFSPSGPRDLFARVGALLVKAITDLEPEAFIFTAIRVGNSFAENIHSYGVFNTLDTSFAKKIGIGDGLILRKFDRFVQDLKST